MADLTIGSNGVSIVHSDKAIILNLIAGEAITAGQPVYQKGAGKAAVADASAAGTAGVRGIALKDTAAGRACPILVHGFLTGYGLTGVAYDSSVFLSDTAGSLLRPALEVIPWTP